MSPAAEHKSHPDSKPNPASDSTRVGASPGGLRRIGYMASAALFFLLGVIGVVVPGLPATPFLLLCSYFLARSSPRLHRALLESRLFGPILREWREYRGIRRQVKLRCVFLIVVVVGVTLWLTDFSATVKGLIAGLVVIGLIVIWRLPTIADEEKTDQPDA